MVGQKTLAALGAVLLFTITSRAYADDAPAPNAAATTNAGSTAGATAEWGGFYNGRTLGSGGGAIVAEAGWPGFTVGALFGVVNKVDLGIKVSPLFAATYETNNFNAAFGLDLRAVARFGIVEGETVSFLARIEPGIRFGAFDPALAWAVEIVVGADVGIHVIKNGTVYVGLEVPLAFYTNPVSFTQIPIFPGAGFEYHVNDFIGVGGRFNAGPSIVIAPNGAGGTATNVDFGFIGTGFFIFRWDRIK